jgi:hypothetical protein
MVIRAIALSLALLVGIGTIVPIATESVEAGKRKTKRYKKKKYKKYSKAWWRQYRAQQRRKRAMQARRRALRLRQLRTARRNAAEKKGNASAAKVQPVAAKAPAMLPSGEPAPSGWQAGALSGSEVQFSVDGGRGTAAISVVGPASGETVSTGRNQAVGGAPTTALRREVINRMIRENGWVVNDYTKQVGEKKVYVVVAQSQANGRLNSRMFYFTEVAGRIYSVSTNTGVDSADRIAEESEKVINSLQPRSRPVQQAKSLE